MRTILRLGLLVYACLPTMILEAQQWTKINPIFDPSGNYRAYQGIFVDKDHGWWITRMPEAILLSTADGGLSWRKLADSIALEQIDFTDTLHGWMAGRILPDLVSYNILITKDGGKTWERHSSPVVTCLALVDSLVGFAGGDSIYKTTDGGISWKGQPREPSHPIGIWDIFFLDRKRGWAVGLGPYPDVGFILSSADSGKSWQFSDSVTTVGLSVYFTDSLHGYVVGSNPPILEGLIKVTSDGGKTWASQYLPCSWLNDVAFTDEHKGWAVGDYGFIWHTTDQGSTWNRVESGTTSHLYRIFFFENGNIGYILGEDGTLLRYEASVAVNEQPAKEAKRATVVDNYPNPFNSLTTIRYSLPRRSNVKVSVFNTLGQVVGEFITVEVEAGSHEIRFDGGNLPSGVYFFRLIAGEFAETKKMVLVH